MRRINLRFTYESKDISKDIEPFILGWNYTDFSHGKADNFSIDLEDTKGLWKDSWFPDKSAKITAGMYLNYKFFSFGTFTIDEIVLSGKPSKVSLKSVSSLITKSLRREDISKSWEHVTLKEILEEISGKHSLIGFYDADEITFIRVDQSNESDLVFLKRLSNENGLNIKLCEEKIIIFSGKEYEQKKSFTAIDINNSIVKNYNFNTKSHDIYKACRVSYWDSNSKKLLTYTYVPDEAIKTGQILKINKRCESFAHAQKRAINELRKKNKLEITGNIKMLGAGEFVAGLNVDVIGIGRLSGKYFIDESSHKQTKGSGYETSIKLRKVLEY
jgi:phage protein D